MTELTQLWSGQMTELSQLWSGQMTELSQLWSGRMTEPPSSLWSGQMPEPPSFGPVKLNLRLNNKTNRLRIQHGKQKEKSSCHK